MIGFQRHASATCVTPTRAGLLRQNENSAYVKAQPDHASMQVTVDVYGRLIPGANRQLVDRLDDTTIHHPGATDTVRHAQ